MHKPTFSGIDSSQRNYRAQELKGGCTCMCVECKICVNVKKSENKNQGNPDIRIAATWISGLQKSVKYDTFYPSWKKKSASLQDFLQKTGAWNKGVIGQKL